MQAFTRYRHLAIDDFDGPPTPDELAAIERALGTALPQDFVDFLMAANGGTLDYYLRVPPAPDGLEMNFSSIYSTRSPGDGEHGYETFLGEIDLERRQRQIPRRMLPFAGNSAASVLYLDLTLEGAGRVVASVRGMPAPDPEEPFIKIAGSFAAFVDQLYLDVAQYHELAEAALASGDPAAIAAISAFLDIGMPDWRTRMGLGQSGAAG